MDPTKPYGEACTPNGGLKEAHEIEWINDPDDAFTSRKSAGYGNKKCFYSHLH
jgi:hypothetical protein